ncbi:MAG TPA: kelch repeat-containing protein [Polyangiaceae bacterium]|jgi:hypothetical protein
MGAKRRARLVAAGALVAGLGAIGFAPGCIDSSPEQTLDGAVGFDVLVPDAGLSFDSAAPPDATLPADAGGDATLPVDSSVPDASGVDSSVPPGDASEDAAPPVDASDAAADAEPPVDAGADAAAGSVTSGAHQLSSFRQGHSATLLANGHVLLCGGYYGSSASQASCDDFDPATSTFSSNVSMIVGRQGHAAVPLASGQVLFAGGAGTNDAGAFDALRSAEIYDPAKGTFTLVSHSMTQGRSAVNGVALTAGANAGKAVLVGGYGDSTYDSGTPNDPSLDTAEVFDPGTDPTTGTFTLLSAHLSARRGGSMTAQPLPEGGLLAAGGSFGPGGGPYTYLDTADTLDPALSKFTATNNAMSVARQGAQSVTLQDGRVFVFGGYTAGFAYAPTADLYDPATGSFTSIALPNPRAYAAVALLKSGRVLIAGGVGTTDAGFATFGDLIVYDPQENAFLPVSGALNPPRSLATATTLTDGRVLIAGGQTAGGPITTAVDIFTE